MCEQTEINYLDGDVVWVKLGACWWPGRVIGLDNLPEDIQTELKKKPLIAAVKFFQEDTYEFVKNYHQIYKYNCTLKDEFIKKGMDKYRIKSKDGTSYMDKFPGDVEMAEKLTGGDPDILNQEKFCPEEKPDISALFGEKKIPKRKRDREEAHRRSADGSEIARKITHPRFLRGESDHEVRIRQQPNSLPSTPTNAGSPVYRCHFCNFTSSRVNVIICHIKSHRSDDSPMPRLNMKTYSQSRGRISETSTPKRKYVKKEKSPSSKKKTENRQESVKRKHSKQTEKSNKKKKSDPELREKLLADWDDESDEEINVDINNSLNNRLSTDSLSTKNQSSFDDGKEHYGDDKDVASVGNSEILAETEKLLKETDQLTSIYMMQDSLDSLHASRNIQFGFDKKSDFENSGKDTKIIGRSIETLDKSQKRDTFDNESKHASDKDDKKSRLSCFDFDEDDLSEPSIPPVRKIPRVFGEKNLSLKKEIIKEFEMSQALKNEIKKEANKISELGKNMELKTDDIIEIIQGRDYRQEKETKVSEKLNESVQGKTELNQSDEDINEEKTKQSENDQQKSNIKTCQTEVNKIMEIFHVKRRDDDDDHSSNVKDIGKAASKIASNVSAERDKMSEKDDVKSTDENLPQSEKTDSEDVIVESNDNASMKEADDTMSERFTTETEDETVSESAETVPEQSENSDTDMLDQSVGSLSGNRIGQVLVKRGRGRPRKNARSTISESTSANKSSKTKANRGNKRIRMSERIEIERKTSDSDTDRSYSGRRRKPNKKYLESDIYVQDPDYKAFRTDESQSESESKTSERVTSKSRRGRRSKGSDKRSNELVTQMDKQEIEVSDQTSTVAENNVSILSIDIKNKVPENKKEAFSEKEEREEEKDERKSVKIKCDVLGEQVKFLDKVAVEKVDIDDVYSENVETTSSFQKLETINETEKGLDVGKAVKESYEMETKDGSSKQTKDNEDFKDHEKSSIVEQTDNNVDKIEIQQDALKTNVDMLPPKKSQIKKFELSQIDFFDSDIQSNKKAEPEPNSELESECRIESEPKIELGPQSESQSNINEKVNEDEIKATSSKAADEVGKFLNIENEQQRDLKSSELQKNTVKSVVKEEETQLMEEVSQKTQDVNQLKLKSPRKSPKADDARNTPKSPTKTLIEQQLTPKKSSMQTRYKGKFTPETGKGRKDKDLFLEEKSTNIFQEAFLKTLQMDKKKTVDNADVSSKEKKESKTAKRKGEEIDVNVAAISAQSKKIDNLNKDSKILADIQARENVPIASDLENIEVIIEEKIEIDKIGDAILETNVQLETTSSEPAITSKSLLQSKVFPVSENNDTSTNVKKLGEIPKMPVATLSSSTSDISVPVKKREMPRIIESVTLTEPVQILKSKLLDKVPPQKGVKHRLLEVDATKKNDQKSGGGPKAKIIKIETLPSNSKVKTAIKSSPHMCLTKKLQVLKTEETDALLEAQSKEQGEATLQTIVTAPVTEKYVQQSTQSLADIELDINSMPFVLSEDVLTPESIEQMPVVISSIIPPSSSIPTTLSFTPTTQIVSPTRQTQFKIANESITTETSPTKKKSGVPAILKTKSKTKPTVTSVKSLIPPLTGGIKGLKFQSAQPPAGKTPTLLTQKGTTPGKYVVVQTAGGQQLRYSVQSKSGAQQKVTISTASGKAAGNAQVIQQGGKVVILTSGQSCQTKMVPLNISKTLSAKVQKIMTSKGHLLCPINPQGSIIATKTVIAPKADTVAAAAVSPTTSKLATSGHKIINTQGIITSKGVLTPISGTIGKTALLGTLSQGILTKDGIYTPISASSLSGKTIIGSKTLVTKGGTTLLSPQAQGLSGTKAILTPVSQTITGKTILGTQAVLSNKGTILTPITGQQVKAIAAKSPVKSGKVQYQLQQKVQLPILQKSSKAPTSAAGSQAKASPSAKSSSGGSTLILQSTASTGAIPQKSISHSKKIIKQIITQPGASIQGVVSPSDTQQTVTMVPQQVPQSKGKAAVSSTVQKVIIPRAGSRQLKTQKIVVQKMQESTTVRSAQTKQTVIATTATIVATTTTTTTTVVNSPIAKTVAQSKQTTPTMSKASSVKGSQASSKTQKKLLTTATTSNVSVTASNTTTLSSLESEKKTKTDFQLALDAPRKEQGKVEKLLTESAEKAGETKTVTQPQIMALPTESSDGTQTYVLVTIDEQGQIQPLDNNALMSLEGTTQNPDGTRTLYIDPSSLGEVGALDNIVLQFDNSVLPNIQTGSSVTETSQTAIVSESFPSSEVIQTSNQDILAAALANTDFQQGISLPENQAGSVMTQTGLTQTSLINQTILQSTIIPPTEPISSPSVLETSLTLNQPIMTPLEVPSNLPIQSTDPAPTTSVVSTIPSSLELPITITNPSISYISATGETQIHIPGNSMPDIGEIMECPATIASEEIAHTEIPTNTQYLVISNLEDSIATTADTPNVPNAQIAIAPSSSYTVTMPNRVLENVQVQTTPSMPIIDDTYADNSQLTTTIVATEQTFVQVPVSEMLVSKASENQVSVSSQKPIISTDKNFDERPSSMLQGGYSSQEVSDTSGDFILQRSANEDTASSTMEVEREMENKGSDTSMTDLSTIDKTTLIASESNSQVESMEQLTYEVTDSSERKTASESHEAMDKLKQLAISEESSNKVKSGVDQQVAGTSNRMEAHKTDSRVLSAESLNPTNDATMELDVAVEEPDPFAGSTIGKKSTKDCQRDEPSSQEESDRRRLRQSMELRFEEEEEAIAEASQETPSQSQYEQFNVSISSDSTDLPSQSASKLESSSGEATQSIAYESMEMDEETVVVEPPSQSFEHTKINEASQSYEALAESNVNAPTQSFNEIVQSQLERPNIDEVIDDQSFPTQSYEVDKGESVTENLETDAEISQEGNIPSQSNDVGVDGIGTSSVSTNNSGLNEDETASSSYVPETPENQERDQDQESAISTSSYEIPPCEELNIASSSVIPDTSVNAEHPNIHDNGVPEIPTSSSYNLNPDITSTHHVDSVPTSSFEDQVIVEQNVSTSYEVPIPMPDLEETCSQNFVTESSDHHRNEPSSYYAHHQEVTASYYESVDQDANSRLEEDPHEEQHVTPGGYYEGNPQEVSQSYFAPTEETPSYTSHGISPGYYDPSRPESEASQSYYSTDDLDGKTEQTSSSPNIEASQSFYQERSSELKLRQQQGEATPTYPERYPVDYSLENSPIEKHDLVESSVPATRPMDR
ncbi:PREDICTED: mucin-17-like [Cyphomyrmex costatus]|uniref:PWWP domain-containing protein n=1 Tax=Cyphomyrmex costatus TaxID=456900 RepID=A0A195CRK2_9HYME|nr:PREDICTED: mucin-17-like [Cyphomyrmex costatus]KYN02739.1 hypothetical protein ALC62_06539 [Cyphomyrmex costatus]